MMIDEEKASSNAPKFYIVYSFSRGFMDLLSINEDVMMLFRSDTARLASLLALCQAKITEEGAQT